MTQSTHQFSLLTLQGAPLDLSAFAGKVLLLVNTASRCGLTPQYEALQRLHTSLAPRGFSVIGFPCNQFGAQEPGDAAQIERFCQTNYGLSFPLTEKIEVNGAGAHPLFVYLRAAAPNADGSEALPWNFTKFLVDREGRAVRRYAPTVAPETLQGDIEAQLGQ